MDIGDMHEVWAAQAEAGYYKDEVEELKKELEKLKAKLKPIGHRQPRKDVDK